MVKPTREVLPSGLMIFENASRTTSVVPVENSYVERHNFKALTKESDAILIVKPTGRHTTYFQKLEDNICGLFFTTFECQVMLSMKGTPKVGDVILVLDGSQGYYPPVKGWVFDTTIGCPFNTSEQYLFFLAEGTGTDRVTLNKPAYSLMYPVFLTVKDGKATTHAYSELPPAFRVLNKDVAELVKFSKP